jgi:hypothetical protein
MAENAITCPTCGVEEPADANGEAPPPLHEVGEFVCDACGARYIFGKLAPVYVVEPNHDNKGLRWVRLRFQHPQTREDLYVADLDPKLALAFAKNVLALIGP